MKRVTCSPILILAMLCVLAAPANADWHEHSKLVASDRDVESLFGACVSISGDYCLVGDSFDDETSIDRHR